MTDTKQTKYNILLFWFNDDWGQYGRAYERVAEHLSLLPDIGRVACIFPSAAQGKEQKAARITTRFVSTKLCLLKELERVSSGPANAFGRARQSLESFLGIRALNGALKKLGFRAENTILWLFPPHPYIERLLKVVPNRGVIAHVIDDFTKFDANHVLYTNAINQYPTLGHWADMILTTSSQNFENFSKFGKPCHMFWPAVDASFFGDLSPMPHRALAQPVRLGYVGFIMDRTDLHVLDVVARSRPQWQILLAGPEYPKGYLTQSGLLDLPNVKHLGPISQEDVPSFLTSLDVCVMPHRDNEYSRSMGPLKLYQYLACGRPIVSTEVAGLDKVKDYISIANNPQDFVALIDKALETDTLELSKKRIALAKENTWSVRVREMFDIVKEQFRLT